MVIVIDCCGCFSSFWLCLYIMHWQNLCIGCIASHSGGMWKYKVSVTNVFVIAFPQIPEGVAVSKEARLAISKAASVFILYATSWWVIPVWKEWWYRILRFINLCMCVIIFLGKTLYFLKPMWPLTIGGDRKTRWL